MLSKKYGLWLLREQSEHKRLTYLLWWGDHPPNDLSLVAKCSQRTERALPAELAVFPYGVSGSQCGQVRPETEVRSKSDLRYSHFGIGVRHNIRD